jgi:hypothetical protein
MGAALTACGGMQAVGVASGKSSAIHASGSQKSLLYVVTSDRTDILTYPDGMKVGSIPNYLGLPCPDPVNGNIYFDSGDIFEYSFGGTKQIGHIYGQEGTESLGCAVDPTTGDLATTWNTTGTRNKGWVAVYKNGSGNPQQYAVPDMGVYYYCGYDGSGNLFVDGVSAEDNSLLAELPKGSNTWTTISLNEQIEIGLIQWDGTYITIQKQSPPTIYQISVSGSSGTVVGTIMLRANNKTKRVPFSHTWIQGDTVLGAQGGFKNPNVGFWHYPQGGKPYKIITGLTKKKKDGVEYVAVDSKP